MPIELSHDHVTTRAVDYAGTVAWYRDKLDFTLDQEWPFGDMQLAYLSNGTAKIETRRLRQQSPTRLSTRSTTASALRSTTTSA